MPNRIKRWFINQFNKNLMVYSSIIIIFAIGIIIGAITIKILNVNQKNEIMLFLNSFFKTVHGNNFTSIAILKRSIVDNFKTIGVIWITSIMFIGVIFIPITALFKGFALGFAVGFLVNECGIEGFLFALLGILPQSLFIIPGIVTIASLGMSFSIDGIRRRKRFKTRNGDFFRRIIDYTIIVILFSVIIFIGCLIEAYISPIFLRLLTKHLL